MYADCVTCNTYLQCNDGWKRAENVDGSMSHVHIDRYRLKVWCIVEGELIWWREADYESRQPYHQGQYNVL